jgi:hypothetical protein
MSNDIVIHNQSDFLAFIRDQAMPSGNLSIRGVARCCGVENTSIIRDGAFNSGRMGQTLVANGFEADALRDGGFPPQAVWLCIEYYAFESRAKAPMAKQIARTFGAIGVMATLKELSQPSLAPQLSCHAIAMQKADAIRHITDELSDNPRLAQLLIDFSINDILTTHRLPGTAQPLRGVAEIAVELGFKVDASNRVKLGNYIKAQGFDSEKEKRLCNGVMTAINCYRDTPELRESIAGYFG